MKHAEGSLFFKVVGIVSIILFSAIGACFTIPFGKVIPFFAYVLAAVLIGSIFIGIGLILDALWRNNSILRMILQEFKSDDDDD